MMETIKELFQKQIQESVKDGKRPNDGDFLRGMTRKQKIGEARQLNPNLSYDQASAYVNRKIEEFEEHKGERLLFFMECRNDGNLSIIKVWEADLNMLEEAYTIHQDRYASCDSSLPKLIKK